MGFPEPGLGLQAESLQSLDLSPALSFFLWFFLSGLTSPRLGFLGFLLPSLTPEMPLLKGNVPTEARKGQVSRWGCVFCFCSVVT